MQRKYKGCSSSNPAPKTTSKKLLEMSQPPDIEPRRPVLKNCFYKMADCSYKRPLRAPNDSSVPALLRFNDHAALIYNSLILGCFDWGQTRGKIDVWVWVSIESETRVWKREASRLSLC
ncbi:hypothetical protein Droror1_Dr00013612 [Drosera rotundifolia]